MFGGEKFPTKSMLTQSAFLTIKCFRFCLFKLSIWWGLIFPIERSEQAWITFDREKIKRKIFVIELISEEVASFQNLWLRMHSKMKLLRIPKNVHLFSDDNTKKSRIFYFALENMLFNFYLNRTTTIEISRYDLKWTSLVILEIRESSTAKS